MIGGYDWTSVDKLPFTSFTPFIIYAASDGNYTLFGPSPHAKEEPLLFRLRHMGITLKVDSTDFKE
jgi:hypothetical protein